MVDCLGGELRMDTDNEQARALYARELGRPLATRADFIAQIAAALAGGKGFAAGKLGRSEKTWLYQPLLLRQNPSTLQRRAFEQALRFHCDVQSGVFPSSHKFLPRFIDFYLEQLRRLDSLGLFLDWPAMELQIVRGHQLGCSLIPFQEQEPDRGQPADDGRCYLPLFRGRRVLLLSSHAEFLRGRAVRETFEGVWARCGKRWFEPARVDALEFPSAYCQQTRQRFATVLDLYESIVSELQRRPFDVALIAAGGLGIPLAAHVKTLGRVGISLGGHLLALFGVLGKRWRGNSEYQQSHVNEYWQPLPERYRPNAPQLVDGGAYW